MKLRADYPKSPILYVIVVMSLMEILMVAVVNIYLAECGEAFIRSTQYCDINFTY
jgi:hypothetical protein